MNETERMLQQRCAALENILLHAITAVCNRNNDQALLEELKKTIRPELAKLRNEVNAITPIVAAIQTSKFGISMTDCPSCQMNIINLESWLRANGVSEW